MRSAAPSDRLREYLSKTFAPPFPVAALVVGVFGIWAAQGLGYESTTWYPGALFVGALVAVVALTFRSWTLSRPALVAAAFFVAYAAWSGISILWSSNRGIAWDGANRTVLYSLVFVLFASLPWPRTSIAVLLCGFSLVATAVGLVELLRATFGEPDDFFIHGRFAAPAGYPNAACALFLMAFWPLAYVAARREPPPLVRGLLLAAGTVLVELAVLCQSRGSLFAVPIAVILYLAIVPRRLRAGVALLVVGTAVLLARGPLLDAYTPVRDGAGARTALTDALWAIGVSALAVLLLWTTVAYLDRRIELSSRTVKWAQLAAVLLVLVGALVGGVAFAAADPGPVDRIGDAWRDFKAGYTDTRSSSHLASGLGNNRYDFWRVALIEFREHPVQGVGADNFAHDYVFRRRSDEEPLYPHSLELRVLAQTGVVGAVLFAGFIAAVIVAVSRGARGADLPSGAALAGVAAVLYWSVHGSADWFWEFPGLTAPAVAWLGLAIRAGPGRAERTTARPRAYTLGVAIVASLAVLSFAVPWLAELSVQRAAKSWARTPTDAFRQLDRARTLNPLSSKADLFGGAIASRLDDLPKMRQFFRQAVEREDRNWYAHFELGLAHAALGDRRSAFAELDRAERLNPQERVIKLARRELGAGRAVDRSRIDRLLRERVRARVGGRG